MYQSNTLKLSLSSFVIYILKVSIIKFTVHKKLKMNTLETVRKVENYATYKHPSQVLMERYKFYVPKLKCLIPM